MAAQSTASVRNRAQLWSCRPSRVCAPGTKRSRGQRCPAPGKLLLSIFSQASARNRGRWRWHCPSSQSAGGDDCVAGHVGLELRNVGKNYPFERSRRFPEIQPNSGPRDYSRLSCGGGETQLGIVPGSQPGFSRGRSVIEAHRRHCKNFCRSRDDPAAAN